MTSNNEQTPRGNEFGISVNRVASHIGLVRRSIESVSSIRSAVEPRGLKSQFSSTNVICRVMTVTRGQDRKGCIRSSCLV